MQKKAYFAGAIVGDRSFSESIKELIRYIRDELAIPVLSEHVGSDDPLEEFSHKIGKEPKDVTAEDVEVQDTTWINESTHMVAEISGASTGTGREIEYARTKEHFGHVPCKILCIYAKEKEKSVSKMIRGMTKERYPNITLASYDDLASAKEAIKEFLDD